MDNGRPPRFGDLYAVGTHNVDDGGPLTFETPRGSLQVHVVLANDTDSEQIDRRAAAAQVIEMTAYADPNSPESTLLDALIAQATDPEDLIAFLVEEDMREPEVEITAEHRTTGKWGKDGYYDSILEAWYGDEDEMGLMYLWEQPPEESDDPIEAQENAAKVERAARMWEEIKAYNEELTEKLTEKRDDLVENYDGLDIDELRERARAVMVKHECELKFMQERQRQRLFYGVRRADDWRRRFYGTLADVDETPKVVRERLMQVYDSLRVPDLVGKDWRRILGFSPSSERSEPEDRSTLSGHAAASPSKTSPSSS